MQSLAPIELPLTDALTCLLAEDVFAKVDVPADWFDGVILAGDRIGVQREWVTPELIGRLGACGYVTVLVHPRPRVVVVPIGAAPEMVVNATGQQLVAEIRLNAADGYLAERVNDAPDAVREAIEEAHLRADFIITAGGASANEGLTQFEDVPVYSLPGEPRAALEKFQAAVSPLIQELRGVTGR